MLASARLCGVVLLPSLTPLELKIKGIMSLQFCIAFNDTTLQFAAYARIDVGMQKSNAAARVRCVGTCSGGPRDLMEPGRSLTPRREVYR